MLGDGFRIGVEIFQYWKRFKGRRVRVWPSELVIRICSESGKEWVTSVEDHEPYWWEESRKRYAEQKNEELGLGLRPDPLMKYAVEHLTDSSTPHIESIEQARLFEATISDIVKEPPGLYLTNIQYWVVIKGSEDDNVIKIESSDEGIFLPFNQIARIDFIQPKPFVRSEKSSWE